MAALILLLVLAVGVIADDLNTVNQSCHAVSSPSCKPEKICVDYIWLTLVAVIATFIQFILLGFTVYYVSINTPPQVAKEGEKKTSGMQTKMIKKVRSTLPQQASPPPKDIFATKDPEPHHRQSPNQGPVTDQNHGQRTNPPSKKDEQEKHTPNIPLPPLPPSDDRHSKASFGVSDEEHEYDYINPQSIKHLQSQVPIGKPEANTSEAPTASDAKVNNYDDETENVYDTFVHLAQEKE